jgi:hypothetical protein
MVETEVIPATANAVEGATQGMATKGAASGTAATNGAASTPATTGSAGSAAANHTAAGHTATTAGGAAKGGAAGKSMFASLGPAKTATMAFVAAHPVGVAVGGGVVVAVGAYYLGKLIANRANRKAQEAAA